MSNNGDEMLGSLFGIGVLITIVWLTFFDGWHSKLRYFIQYGNQYSSVSYDQVTIVPKPHDCEWSTSPLGNKNCHYEPDVSAVLTSVNTQGKAIVSYDRGKTWLLDNNSPPVKPSVYVSWKKLED